MTLDGAKMESPNKQGHFRDAENAGYVDFAEGPISGLVTWVISFLRW